MRCAAMASLLLIAAIQGSSEAKAFQDKTVSGPREDVVLDNLVVNTPLSHENLALYILEDPAANSLGEFITFEEGIKTGRVRVSEKQQAQVNELLIENGSAKHCYVQAGDVVKGGQQDRAIATDFVVPPRSGKIRVPSFCVERGRWSGGSGSAFGTTTGLVVGTPLKAAIQKDKDQDKVWQAVEEAKTKLVKTNSLRSPVSTSLNEQLLDRRIHQRLESFIKVLGNACEKKEHAVGLATAINGKMSTADVYADPGLFRKLYPRLLAAAALEAISTPRQEAKAPSTLDASRLLASANRGKPTEEKHRGRLSTITREGTNTLQFMCFYKNVALHRQSLVRP